MTNHGRRIFPQNVRAPHRIIPPLLLLVSPAAATPSATVPMSTDNPSFSSSSSPDYAYSNADPSPSIFIVVRASAFFFVGLFAIYIRQFVTEDSAGATNPDGSAAARLRRPTGGLDPEVIDSFPIFRYSEVKELKMGKGSALECAVCISEFEDHEKLRLIPKCHHVFHFECIEFWLASHSTCPVCRADLVRSPGKTESTHSVQEQSIRSEPGVAQNQNQIPIDVDEYRNEDPERVAKFPRSHSTGHSLCQPGENCESVLS
ncbi:E3 ubiquitin-protein ligase ATL6-like [Actinidia eriantha]|uniref:E3 ubiquitin-protein ligase ATL6-like n=1 Tax=Actinidia eriantha TaxID=165200 RepID=UPI0025907654|nr:E3 ubiquitin-protein ligase ATL6-like [Actinidia eriantha]